MLRRVRTGGSLRRAMARAGKHAYGSKAEQAKVSVSFIPPFPVGKWFATCSAQTKGKKCVPKRVTEKMTLECG